MLRRRLHPGLLGEIPNAADGGTDDCANYNFALPACADNCQSLTLRWEFPNSPGRAGLDNVDISGVPSFTPITDAGGGDYTTNVQSCIAVTQDLSCTWDNSVDPTLTDTGSVVHQ